MRFVDFFAGAGGASTGIIQAGHEVVVAINHNPKALAAHARNHPETVHLNEDVREVDPYLLQQRFHTDGAWLSPACTFFSGANGGTSLDAQSRQLAEVFVHYARVCRWKIILVENVREFMKWGPIRPRRSGSALRGQTKLERRYCTVQLELMEAVCVYDKAREQDLRIEMDALAEKLNSYPNYDRKRGALVFVPDEATAGTMYFKWLRHFQEMGYDFDSRLLDSADYGAAQSRLRFFGVFIKQGSGLSFKWPRPTHAKVSKPKPGEMALMPSGMQPHVACATILHLDDPGPSIFNRPKNRKPLVAATLERIRTGLEKYAHEGQVLMVDRYHSGSVPVSCAQPMPTVLASMDKALVKVTTVDSYAHNTPVQGIQQPLPTAMAKRDKYLATSYIVPSSFSNQPYSLNEPLGTVLASRHHTYVCHAQFIAKDYTSGSNPGSQTSSVQAPLGTVMGGNRHNVVQVGFLSKYYGTGGSVGLGAPIGTLTTHDRYSLVHAVCSTYGSNGNPGANTGSVDKPLTTVTTTPHHYLSSAFLAYSYGGHNSAKHVTRIGAPVNTICTGFTPQLITPFVMDRRGGGQGNSAKRTVSPDAPLNTVTSTFLPYLLHAVHRLGQDTAPASEPYVLEHYDPTKPMCPWTRREGPYVVDNRILDIRYRMLYVEELRKAQGFPEGYFDGIGATEAKHFIGNAVQVDMARALVQSFVPSPDKKEEAAA